MPEIERKEEEIDHGISIVEDEPSVDDSLEEVIKEQPLPNVH